MLFSVIIPTHNRALKIEKCLDSLILQTEKNFEVIVVDDGSSDNTKEVIKPYFERLNLQYLYQEIPSGRAAKPRNVGAGIAQGEWLCFLDSDDWWFSTKLEEMKILLPDYDVIYHGLDSFNEKGKVRFRPQWGRKLNTPVFEDLMTGHNALITSATIIRKKIFDQVQGFHEIDLEDYDLWLRVARITDRFYFLPKILGGYWTGGGNTTQVSELEIKRLDDIFNKHKVFLKQETILQAEYALSFIKGRIYHKMKNFKMAQLLYQESRKSTNRRIKMKSKIFSGLCLLEL